MKIKAIVFDMDGVLIDARDWHYEALNEALGLFGFEISRHDHLTAYDGLSTRKKLEMLSLERGLPRGLHEFLNTLKQQFTMKRVYACCKPLFQHEYALATLRGRGYKLAVASNSVRNSVKVMMDLSKLSPYFNATLSNEDVTRCKPDPEIYLRSFEMLDVDANETLIVEDNINGINAAKAAGGNVFVVKEITDVTLDNLEEAIRRAECADDNGGKA